jgi:hypothetical protein
MDTTSVACRGEALREIWWRGRQWAVTSYGIECLDGTYSFEAKRLAEGLHSSGPVEASWCVSMAEKGWVDVDDFATAWLVGAVTAWSPRSRRQGAADDHLPAGP